MSGGTFNSVSDDEARDGDQAFETARNPGDRPQLYRLVEGHAWTGDWIEGGFVDDDEIYNSLDERPALASENADQQPNTCCTCRAGGGQVALEVTVSTLGWY